LGAAGGGKVLDNSSAMRRLEDWVRKIEVVALVVVILIFVVFFIISRLRG
jgi:cell division protein FtsX